MLLNSAKPRANKEHQNIFILPTSKLSLASNKKLILERVWSFLVLLDAHTVHKQSRKSLICEKEAISILNISTASLRSQLYCPGDITDCVMDNYVLSSCNVVLSSFVNSVVLINDFFIYNPILRT